MQSIAATRAAPRHALQLSLRFLHQQRLRSGITENVSATGMYLLASNIPSAGELLHMTLLPSPTSGQIEVLAEVRWGRSAPTLDFPQPGFGVQFIEFVAAEQDQAALVTLLERLSIAGARSQVHIETRDNSPLAVYRFA